jgi:hypothetical protein
MIGRYGQDAPDHGIAFMRFRSSPSQESIAENSSLKRSSFRGSDHSKALLRTAVQKSATVAAG